MVKATFGVDVCACSSSVEEPAAAVFYNVVLNMPAGRLHQSRLVTSRTLGSC